MMKRLMSSMGIVVLAAVLSLLVVGPVLAEEPQEEQFDPAKLREAIESCPCSSSWMDLYSRWNREHYEEIFGLYNDAYEQGLATELSGEAYWSAPWMTMSREHGPESVEDFGISIDNQPAASLPDSPVEMVNRQNVE